MRFAAYKKSVAVGAALVALGPYVNAAETGNPDLAEPAGTLIAAGVRSSSDGSIITYEAPFFQPYQSVTAADMLRWVPGGAALIPNEREANNQQNKRGFGSGGDQILINGKRLSGKSNDISSAIQRIQASVVSRIEVIRGTSAGLDVRSEGTLINIVLAEEVTGGSGAWQLHSGFYGDSPKVDGLISYSDSAGSMNYLVSAQYGPYNRGEPVDRIEELFDAGSGALFERRDIQLPSLTDQVVLNTSGNWDFANGDVLNLNARVEDNKRTQIEDSLVTVVGDPDTQKLQNTLIEDGIAWELGGDIENHIGDGILKTRAIYSSKNEDKSESVSLSSSVPGNVPSQSLILTDSLSTETIIRSSYGWPLTAGQNLELGIEGAINTLDKNVLLFEVLADGSLNPIDLFNSDSDVEENRYEFFSTHFWQMQDNVALETALNFEYSKIEQIGVDIDNARSFTYIKPRFDLRWDITDSNQLRGSLERTVSQLNFADFVATFDNDNDQVNAGNPELEPEKAWEWKLTFEKRLPNDSGVLATELFFNQIEDHIDKVAVTNVSSTAGNIGDAKVYGAFLRGSLRLAPLGLEGAVIDAEYRIQNSETTDPFTGEKREMIRKPKHRYTLKFRHDVTALKLNYSVDLEWFAERVATDINYQDRSETLTPRLSATAQYRLTDSLLLWFEARRISDESHRRYRQRYSGNIADDNLLRTEVREDFRRSTFILGLRGQF